MLWISIYEEVLSGKSRKLAKKIGCSQNEAVGLLARLWMWGAKGNAGRDGSLIGVDKEDLAETLNVGLAEGLSAIKVVEAMIETGWIEEEKGNLYLHDWKDWQGPLYKLYDRREKDKERKRRERAKTKEEAVKPMMEADLPSPKLIIPPTEEPKKPPAEKKPATEYPTDFKEFWEVYPRKVAKGNAYKKYMARIKSGWKPEELIEAAKNYASKVHREKTEECYIKHPATFLSDTEPFTDFLPAKPVVDNSDDDAPYQEWGAR